jgi:uncharacterized protein YyaL (SSP411 family)
MAAITLLRMYAYTNEKSYHDKAEDTLEVFAGMAEQFGIFGATYGIAGVQYVQPHTQVVVVGEGEEAERLRSVAVATFAFNKAVIHLTQSAVVSQNLPPALAATIPGVPGIAGSASIAIVCSGASCQPPASDPRHLEQLLRASNQPAA